MRVCGGECRLATGAHAVDWIARTTGLLPATIFRTTRQLQIASPDLWPKAKKGGGRGAADLEEPHLVNLGIALAVADHPITAAPASVRRFRALMPISSVLDGTGSHLARTLHEMARSSQGPASVSASNVWSICCRVRM